MRWLVIEMTYERGASFAVVSHAPVASRFDVANSVVVGRRRGDLMAEAEVRDALVRHIFKEKLDQDPGLRIRGLGPAFRQGLLDSPETAIGHQVPIFIKIGLRVPLQEQRHAHM